MSPNLVMSRARRPKNGWSMQISKIVDTYQMDIMYKNSKGQVGPYSSSEHTISAKVPWGPPVSCKYKSRLIENGEIQINIFEFLN